MPSCRVFCENFGIRWKIAFQCIKFDRRPATAELKFSRPAPLAHTTLRIAWPVNKMRIIFQDDNDNADAALCRLSTGAPSFYAHHAFGQTNDYTPLRVFCYRCLPSDHQALLYPCDPGVLHFFASVGRRNAVQNGASNQPAANAPHGSYGTGFLLVGTPAQNPFSTRLASDQSLLILNPDTSGEWPLVRVRDWWTDAPSTEALKVPGWTKADAKNMAETYADLQVSPDGHYAVAFIGASWMRKAMPLFSSPCLRSRASRIRSSLS